MEVERLIQSQHLNEVSNALEHTLALADEGLTEQERNVTSIISQAITETESHGFSISR